MRERALAAGGTLEAGPVSGGGWRVRATLPIDRPSGRPSDRPSDRPSGSAP
jgi:hypothetical protein